MAVRALVLIDGEHYPPVVLDALGALADRFAFVAAVFLGGTEKISGGEDEGTLSRCYGMPVHRGSATGEGLEEAIRLHQPAVVVDLSDEPVLGYPERFRLISIALSRGVSYEGSDFRFSPPSFPRLSSVPSLSIIGTGKRVGKTAISGYVARTLQDSLPHAASSPGVVVVAMGRGGPEEPEVIDGRQFRLTVADLLSLSRQGRHASSDHVEDAALSRVMTVGCRRCGGGMAGRPFVSNVERGARLADALSPTLTIFEGSGAALPPVATDVRLLVAGANQAPDTVVGYLGTYRLLLSDAVVLTMAEEPLTDEGALKSLLQGIEAVKPGIPVVPVAFRPRPTEPVAGRDVAFFTTAGAHAETLGRHLEDESGCRVLLASGNLSDRRALRADLERPEMDGVDLVLTEIKAAAIDVVAEAAEQRGLPVMFVDNVPIEVPPGAPGQLHDLVLHLADLAVRRHRA